MSTPAAAPLTLAIEAATYTASCALVEGATLLGERTVETRGSAGEPLLPAIVGMLRDAGAAWDAVGRIVCGEGPGSFTALRVGAATAKGLALALNVPLLAVSSPALIVAGAADRLQSGMYCAVLDAMRGERFTQRVERRERDGVRTAGPVSLVPADSLGSHGSATPERTIGPGMSIDAVPHARGVAVMAASELIPVDLRGWEPSYGRIAEAQARWEAAHGRPLGT